MDFNDEGLVGKYVAVQFSRPLYMFEYGAHVKADGAEWMAPAPLLEEAVESDKGKSVRLVARDFAIGRVVKVGCDLILELTVPSGDQQTVTVMHKTVDGDLVVAVDVVDQHEAPVPQAVRHQRERPAAGAASSKIIL